MNYFPSSFMSKNCLACSENETNNFHNICDPCYDNAGEFLEQNIHQINAIPYLINAAWLALEEIDQWVEVMGGSEDPRTAAAIKALVEATSMATTESESRNTEKG